MTQPENLITTGPRGLPTGIDVVVFDFDDTLAETMPARIAAMRHTFETAGIRSPSPEEYVASQRGVPLQTSLDGFDGGRGAELGLLRLYRIAYWHKEPGLLRLFDGVTEMLRSLASAGVGMGLLTSKARDIVVEGRAAGAVVEVAELGLSDLFAHAVGVEDVTHPKPHPEGLERLLVALGATPERALVVGDSEVDMLTARNAGCWSCLAGWGVPAADRRFDAAMPDAVAEHPGGVLRMVRGGWGG